MICRHCGKELKKVADLTENEIADITYINNQESTVAQSLNPETIKGMDFNDNELFEYFRAVFDAKAKIEFLRYNFYKALYKRLELADNIEVLLEEENGVVGAYIHSEE